MNFKTIIILTIFTISAFFSQAQVNDKVSNFTLKNLVDNTDFSLNTYSDATCIVIIFVSDYCPYSKSYKGRIKDIVEKFSTNEKVKFLLINPENSRDKIEKLKTVAKASPIPYLFDKGQKVTKMFVATKTPEAFVLQKNLENFIIKYHGAIDDNPQMAEEVNKTYLRDAIGACLKKASLSIANHKPTGCTIKAIEE